MKTDYVNIYGINIKNTTLEQTLDNLMEILDGDRLYTIATPNTEIAMRAKDNPHLSQLINSFDLVVADGIGLILASKYRKFPLEERVTGFDISIGLLDRAKKKPFNLYMLGSKPGHTDLAKKNIQKKYPGVTVVGHHHGYFTHDQEQDIVEDINQSGADVIFVGLGFPKQEQFIQEYKDQLKGKIIIGNGGVIDILAGQNKRAPDIFIKLNLEWLYRLLQEPSRIGRQLVLPKFVISVIMDKNSVGKGDNITND